MDECQQGGAQLRQATKCGLFSLSSLVERIRGRYCQADDERDDKTEHGASSHSQKRCVNLLSQSYNSLTVPSLATLVAISFRVDER